MAVQVLLEQPGPAAPLPEPIVAAYVVCSSDSPTNPRLAAAFAAAGVRACALPARSLPEPSAGTLVLNRIDVLPTLDGIGDGLWRIASVPTAGAVLLNRPAAILTAHDKLRTAEVLTAAGIPHPRTVHVVRPDGPVDLEPPWVVKPRFGSWGADVHLCRTTGELRATLHTLARRRWFERQGALVQELVAERREDLRMLVAAGVAVGAIRRRAAPGEWRTNVSLGGSRLPATPPADAVAVAERAVSAAGLDLAGADLIRDRAGRFVVLELNGAVDFTDEYRTDGRDVFEIVARRLLELAWSQRG